MSTLAQIADRYLFEKDPTAENVVYAFYIGTRYMLLENANRPKLKASAFGRSPCGSRKTQE